MSEFGSAMLLCHDRSERVRRLANGVPGIITDLVIDGLELPGSSPLFDINPYSTAKPKEIELQWPQAMLDTLAGYYEQFHTRDNSHHYNCHLFAMRMAGVAMQDIVYDKNHLGCSGRILNALYGPRVNHNQVQNTYLYGSLTPQNHLIHSAVGTNISDTLINVTGYRDYLALTTVGETERLYGHVREYTIATGGMTSFARTRTAAV